MEIANYVDKVCQTWGAFPWFKGFVDYFDCFFVL